MSLECRGYVGCHRIWNLESALQRGTFKGEDKGLVTVTKKMSIAKMKLGILQLQLGIV